MSGQVQVRPGDVRGRALIRVDIVATALFMLTSAAAVLSDSPLRIVAVVVALAMFVGGSLAYLVGYGRAVQRSRTVEISMAGLVLLKDSAPTRVRRLLGGATALQVATAIVAASVRPFTTLAFGILAPMLGVGIQAWWAAAYGTFPARARPTTKNRRPQAGQQTPMATGQTRASTQPTTLAARKGRPGGPRPAAPKRNRQRPST